MSEDCRALQAEINRLRAENERLRRALNLARKVIVKQREQLTAVQTTAWGWICKAREVMSENLPRGTWALWRGRLEVAGQIYSIVRANWANWFYEAIAGLEVT